MTGALIGFVTLACRLRFNAAIFGNPQESIGGQHEAAAGWVRR